MVETQQSCAVAVVPLGSFDRALPAQVVSHADFAFDPAWSPDGSVLVADVPGCDEGRVDVRMEDNILTITGRRAQEDEADHDATYAEYQPLDFERAFSVSELIDTEKIEATVKDGVLRLTLPKAEEAKPKKIAIQTG